MHIKEGTYVSKIWLVQGMMPANAEFPDVPPVETNVTFRLYRDGEGPWVIERTIRVIADDKFGLESQDPQFNDEFRAREGLSEEKALQYAGEFVESIRKRLDRPHVYELVIQSSNQSEIVAKMAATDWCHVTVLDNPTSPGSEVLN